MGILQRRIWTKAWGRSEMEGSLIRKCVDGKNILSGKRIYVIIWTTFQISSSGHVSRWKRESESFDRERNDMFQDMMVVIMALCKTYSFRFLESRVREWFISTVWDTVNWGHFKSWHDVWSYGGMCQHCQSFLVWEVNNKADDSLERQCCANLPGRTK